MTLCVQTPELMHWRSIKNRMGSSKLWRLSDRLPVSIQAALLFVSLILVLSTVSFQMLPTWGDNIDKLLVGVSWVTTTKNVTTEPSHNFTSAPPPGVDLGQQTDANSSSFEETSDANSSSFEETSDTNFSSFEETSPIGAPETTALVPPLSLPNSTKSANSSVITVNSEINSTSSTDAADPLPPSPAPAPASPAPAPSVVVSSP
jgi:hypothetical protein